MERYSPVEKEYIRWLYDMVLGPEDIDKPSYMKLLLRLYNLIFEPVINPMDTSRVIDGENLRYRFGREHGLALDVVEDELCKAPCSVLELLIALSLRCEEQIMDNPAAGDRTGLWFWIMITNLGLGIFTDERYDDDAVDAIVETFINREYNRDGSGGNIFIFSHRTEDIRKIDIWYQMCWFISDFIKDEEEDGLD